MSEIPNNLSTWCFRCHAKRDIINPKKRITKNNRKLWEGICCECDGKLALMSGYATLPEIQFAKEKSQNDTK